MWGKSCLGCGHTWKGNVGSTMMMHSCYHATGAQMCLLEAKNYVEYYKGTEDAASDLNGCTGWEAVFEFGA